MEVSKNISSDPQQKKENLDTVHYTDTIVLMKKIFFLSFYDLGSCKSLEGDRWVVI